jgi:hypothetical protein
MLCGAADNMLSGWSGDGDMHVRIVASPEQSSLSACDVAYELRQYVLYTSPAPRTGRQVM